MLNLVRAQFITYARHLGKERRLIDLQWSLFVVCFSVGAMPFVGVLRVLVCGIWVAPELVCPKPEPTWTPITWPRIVRWYSRDRTRVCICVCGWWHVGLFSHYTFIYCRDPVERSMIGRLTGNWTGRCISWTVHMFVFGSSGMVQWKNGSTRKWGTSRKQCSWNMVSSFFLQLGDTVDWKLNKGVYGQSY